jgi:hypothetical protein
VGTASQTVAVEVPSRTVLWSHALGYDTWGEARLYPSPNGRRLAVVKDWRFLLLDEGSGKRVATYDLGGIVDVDFSPDGSRLFLTMEHTWRVARAGELPTPATRIEVYSPEDGRYRATIEVPNCSSLLALTPDGRRGFLAPTTCERPPVAEQPPGSHDPVSVIDLRDLRFERNLPGFGPVDVASDGSVAVAFMDTWNLDVSLFDDPAEIPSGAEGHYRLMLIDTATLEFDSVALGENLPRYALTPDGQVVLVDVDWMNDWNGVPVRVLDVASRSLDTVRGPEVQLDHFAIHPNSEDVFLLQYGDLYHLSVADRRVERLETGRYLEALNLTPSGEHLLLLDEHGKLAIYDVAERAIEREMHAEVTAPIRE